VIEIIVREEATARFLARHLYSFFVADEPQVPAWSVTPPQDPQAIEALVQAYRESDGDIRHVMRTLLLSDFFQEARFRRVKCPAELIAGVLKLTGDFRAENGLIGPGLNQLDGAARTMGQALMDPPSVEGWHTGKEWIDGGTLTERINFAVNQVKVTSKPGIQEIIKCLQAAAGGPGGELAPEALIERLLQLAGYLELSPESRQALLAFAAQGGPLSFESEEARSRSEARVGELLTLIVATPEYQFA
jgi:Protein of unknown function (DUF1800)